MSRLIQTNDEAVLVPENESARLDSLRGLQILDTEPEQEYDDITLLASQICDAPIALISLIDGNRQWFKSKVGMVEAESPRDESFCSHGIRQRDLFVIEDATMDSRFASNPMVTGTAHIRFYAGSPLVTSGGHAVGMLCVKDRKPRRLDEKQQASLRALARQVVVQLELRRNLKTLQDMMAERELAEKELRQTHQKLVEASRRAGMAEVATSVLHNVGNVLNSVNVSSSLVAEKIRNSKVGNVARIAGLIRSHENDLDAFLSKDMKGKEIVGYLENLAAHLAQEQDDILHEVGSLVNNIVHIREIVSMQQNYGKTSGVLESVRARDLMEDALALNRESMVRHNIEVIRDYSDTIPVLADKHKVIQILINLIRNAKHACNDSASPDRKIWLYTSAERGAVRFTVRDSGIGITKENLTRIFNHGFTTRKGGHGFGLHSGALAAKELEGSLVASSEGQDLGATFILQLPIPK